MSAPKYPSPGDIRISWIKVSPDPYDLAWLATPASFPPYLHQQGFWNSGVSGDSGSWVDGICYQRPAL